MTAMHSLRLAEYISKKDAISVEEAELLVSSTIEELTDQLKHGEEVILPGLGSMEVRVMPGRKSVLFKYYPRLLNEELPSFLFEAVSELLSEGENVILPSFGTFQPIFNENVVITRISFILSPVLRSEINGSSLKDEPDQKITIEEDKSIKPSSIEIETDTDTSSEGTTTDLVVDKNEKQEPETLVPTKKHTSSSKSPKRKRINYDAVASPAPKKARGIFKVLLPVACILLVVLFIWIKSRPDLPDIDPAPSEIKNSSRTLLDLSKERYGHAAYWVYIYDTNRERLSSPLALVKETEILFPDLKADYHVDTRDSLEIVRANMMGEELLKKYK